MEKLQKSYLETLFPWFYPVRVIKRKRGIATRKNKLLVYFMLPISVFLLSSCAIVRPGEVGVKQKLGKLSDEIATHGSVFYNPFTSKVVKTSIQTNNLELSLRLPSKG